MAEEKAAPESPQQDEIRTEFMTFRKNPMSKALRYDVVNNKTGFSLGHIGFYQPWRQHCLFPSGRAAFSAGCLRDVEELLGKLDSKQPAAATPAPDQVPEKVQETAPGLSLESLDERLRRLEGLRHNMTPEDGDFGGT